METAAVVMSKDEAIELYCSWCMQFSPNENDVTDRNDPEWEDYWSEMLGYSDAAWDLDDGNCSFFEILPMEGFEECGSAVKDLDVWLETIFYIPCKRSESLFHAAYGSIEDIVDEFQNDDEFIVCNQSRQWIKDHLVYISCVMYG
jgi:hypothetical protein